MLCDVLSVAATLFAMYAAMPGESAPQSVYSRAVQLTQAGKYDQALQELNTATRLTPNDPKLQNMIGIVLTQLGRLEEADLAFTRALELSPSLLAARKNRAINRFQREDYQFARAEFERLVELSPRDAAPHLFLGLLSMKQLDFPTARDYLVRARGLAPNTPEILLPLTTVFLSLGDRAQAIECARQIPKLPATKDADRFQLAVSLARFEIHDEAAAIFEQLFLKNPEYESGFNLALARYRSGEMEAALVPLNELARQGYRPAELLNLHAWVLHKLKRTEEARRLLRHAIDVEPSNADHYLDLSTVLNDEGNREAGFAVLSEGMTRAARVDRLHVQAGLFHREQGADVEAESSFRRALQVNPLCEPAYIALANLLLTSEREPEAYNVLLAGTGKLPKSPYLQYVYGLAMLDAAQNRKDVPQMERALSSLQAAEKLAPFSAEIQYALGRAHLVKNEEDKAESYFQRAINLNPRHASAYYQLSRIARMQGFTSKAEKFAQIVRKLREREQERDREELARAMQESTRDSLMARPR